MKDRRDKRTADLLNWEVPQIQVGFLEEEIRAANIASKVAKAVSLALKGKSRPKIAEEMSVYLGEEITKPMLDAYSSEARNGHNINLIRLAALVHVTKDMRLLSVIPELFGYAVIPAKHLHLIEIALLAEKQEEITRTLETKKRYARGGFL